MPLKRMTLPSRHRTLVENYSFSATYFLTSSPNLLMEVPSVFSVLQFEHGAWKYLEDINHPIFFSRLTLPVNHELASGPGTLSKPEGKKRRRSKRQHAQAITKKRDSWRVEKSIPCNQWLGQRERVCIQPLKSTSYMVNKPIALGEVRRVTAPISRQIWENLIHCPSLRHSSWCPTVSQGASISQCPGPRQRFWCRLDQWWGI